jgi:hypothetical protein
MYGRRDADASTRRAGFQPDATHRARQLQRLVRPQTHLARPHAWSQTRQRHRGAPAPVTHPPKWTGVGAYSRTVAGASTGSP